MTPGQFLRLIWPDEGHYCIAHQFTPADSDKPQWYHKVFPTISEAVTHCLREKHQRDVWFAVLSLREPKVWNDKKSNPKTGELGKYEIRPHHNMLAAKALFWDLDVGSGEGKYAGRDDAVRDLVRFLKETRLPVPTLIGSGSGLHVYWHLDTTVPVDRWLSMANHLKQLGKAHGVRFDPSRTVDESSVLRVLGTFNYKDKHNPAEVRMLGDTIGAVSPVGHLDKAISDALIRADVTPEDAPKASVKPIANPLGESNVDRFQDFGPPPTLKEVAKSCAQVAEIIRYHSDDTHPNAPDGLDNNGWHKGMLPLFRHFEDGENLCRKLTAARPRTNQDVDVKLAQIKSENVGPSRCETIAENMPWGDTPCRGCMFFRDPSVPNPLVAARKTVTAPPPIIQALTPGAGAIPALIPDPPRPYKRLKTGQIARVTLDKDKNENVEIIFDCDLYPVKRFENPDEAEERHVWRVHLPRAGVRDFAIEADALYDSRKFCAAIANNGLYPDKANVNYLQDYMTAYIRQLQKTADADKQRSHLGWHDEYETFVTPDKTFTRDGVTASALTEAATRAAQFIRRKGDLQAQIQLMRFYNHPAYIPNQFAILCNLASFIFYATGQHGIVVNMSGEAGASKSTTLYAGAGLIGHPELWPLNGTNSGATAKARPQRVSVNANYPTPVDEITDMPDREVGDLVMNITQPGHRLRLQTDGTERKVAEDNYKSAIMIATANSTLHAVLARNNAAGTAGSMRVFEMKFVAQDVHTKAEADEFLRQLMQNHGHIADVFIQYVVANRPAVEALAQQRVREIDEAIQTKSAERFWSAVIAVVVATAEICEALGLLTYSAAQIRDWAVKVQVPHMRGTVSEEYRSPIQVLTDYIAEKSGNIVIIERDNSIGVSNTIEYRIADVKSALLGHYDRNTGKMHLLKEGLRDYCQKIGLSHTRVVDELYQPRGSDNPRRIILDKNARPTLGKGTNLAKGQQYCYTIDMTHPEIAGTVPTLVDTSGGNATMAKVAND